MIYSSTCIDSDIDYTCNIIIVQALPVFHIILVADAVISSPLIMHCTLK